MTSQNEENEHVPQTPFTQKRTPRGVTSINKVIRARSENVKSQVEWNMKGQPLNNKGENFLVSYIEVLVTFDVGEEHKQYILKYAGKALRQFITDAEKCLRDVDVNFNLKTPAKYANLIDEADRMEFVTLRTQDNRTKRDTFEYRRPQCSFTLKEKASLLQTPDSQAVLDSALGLPQYSGRIQGAGFGVSKRCMLKSKDSKGHQASTVSESFTNPRHLTEGKVIAEHSETSSPKVENASKKTKVVKS
ncbi:hypothetical protein Lal_00017120 [Lupinus albus]|nr:hypothetical protein Lal_00017120 [Lupinus albus]